MITKPSNHARIKMEMMSFNSKIDRPRLRFSSVLTNTRVTALSFVNSFILLGEGNNLICYSNHRRVNQTSVFKNSVIHGICPSIYETSNDVTSYILAVYGAKSLAIISASTKLDTFEFDKCLLYSLEDWIWDVKWMNENVPVLAIALAHNSVLLWDCERGVVARKTQSSELSLLYSACIIGTSWDNLVVAAGTVFQEILLWSPLSLEGGDDRGQVLQRLTGHQGVIFSIKFNLDENILCSTSDDRTVRVWKFSQPLDSDLTLEAFKCGTFSLIHTLYGHESRVWQSVILPNRRILVSIGEDSNICLWNYNDGSLIESKNLSCGGLWSLAVDENEIVIAMGGGDGSLSLLDLSKKPFTLEETISPIPSFCPEKDFFRDIALIEDSNVIATTNSGLVTSYDVVTLKWRQLLGDSLLGNYSVLSVSEKGLDGQFIAVGTLSGAVFLINENLREPYILKAHDGKIHSLYWLKNTKDKLMMTCGPEGCVRLWNVNANEFSFVVNKFYEITLPICKQRFPSTVLTTNDKSLCILGDRMGGLHVYNTQPGFIEKLPFHSLVSFHGKNGVTDICEIDDLILTTGRDGQIATFRLSKSSGLDLLYSFKVPGSKLEWIGRIVRIDESSSFLLAGFRTMKFVLWSRKKQSNLVELSCGGGHRSWDVSLGRKDQDYSFIFTCLRKNRLTTWIAKDNIEGDALVTLKTGFHSSKIWCGSFLFVKEDSFYVATGGEDNLILISKFLTRKSDADAKYRLSLTGHISIVRALVFLRFGEMKGLLLSAGGQSQFILWQIWLDPSSGEIGHARLANHFLREKNTSEDQRMRYMDAIIRQSCIENRYNIYLACSDSKIRLFQFELSSRKVRYINCVTVGNSCVFRLDTLIQSKLFVSGDGNGFLKVWETNDSNFLEMFLVKSHDGGINSVANLYLNDNSWLICSGGDDNKIAINILRKTSSTFEILTSYEASTAHAAQVTGLRLKMLNINRGLIYSVSIDQRLNIWEWTISGTTSESKISLNLVSSTFSHVADVAGCLVICEDNRIDGPGGRNMCDTDVLVFGSGVELFKQIKDS